MHVLKENLTRHVHHVVVRNAAVCSPQKVTYVNHVKVIQTCLLADTVVKGDFVAQPYQYLLIFCIGYPCDRPLTHIIHLSLIQRLLTQMQRSLVRPEFTAWHPNDQQRFALILHRLRDDVYHGLNQVA